MIGFSPKAVRIVLSVSFVLTVCFPSAGCDILYRLLHKEGAEERELVGEIVPMQKNDTVEEVQALLKIYGYSPGKIDGKMGMQTRDAVEQFQRDNGLKETRFVDRATWEKLAVLKESDLVVGRKVNVKLVQEALKRAGFDPGPADGKMGKKTQNAIMAFQRSAGLTADGRIGYQTLCALAEYLPAAAPATRN
ncbi:MAG: peptidoglycan-binding protein [Candidatus Omnitrophica bacterium]|nr:peptidoglycan-binding protein [Candidatus Omnitrophota bacterium]